MACIAPIEHESGSPSEDLCLVRENAVLCVAAEVLIGVTRGCHAALVVQSRLLCEALARLELVLPFLADLDDDTGKLVACDDRVCVDVLRAALVLLALQRQLVG